MHEFEPVPLWEAARLIAERLNLDHQKALDAIVAAAAAKQIKVYGKPRYDGQEDRIRPRIWRKVARGEARLVCADPSPGESDSGNWSDLYVFRADLERLLPELAGEDTAADGETGSPRPAAGATGGRGESQSEKAKLRRRVKEVLESEAKKDPPRAQTKAEWQQLVRQEYGNAVTDNLFAAVWREAKLPAAWRAPGRRS
ncbi:MAG: hypothetical protein JOY83_08350 [Alphaproteobacteria bacterium]|nr:hypothetical protein [Alphaproteobacteria bacterium]